MPAAVPIAIGAGALVSGGMAYAGAKSQESAAKRAAKLQQEAADRATQAQLDMYNQSRADMAPWRDAGGRSLGELEAATREYADVIRDPSKYKESPGYQWAYDQGVKGLQAGAAASGKLDSGQNLQDLVKYGQGMALQDYQGYLGRLDSLLNRYAGTAGMGQNTAMGLAGMGQNLAGQLGNIYGQAANAQAAGIYGQANARTSLYNNLGNIFGGGLQAYGMYQGLRPSGNPPSTQSTATNQSGMATSDDWYNWATNQ